MGVKTASIEAPSSAPRHSDRPDAYWSVLSCWYATVKFLLRAFIRNITQYYLPPT